MSFLILELCSYSVKAQTFVFLLMIIKPDILFTHMFSFVGGSTYSALSLVLKNTQSYIVLWHVNQLDCFQNAILFFIFISLFLG